mgnify:CR=1 FL=1
MRGKHSLTDRFLIYLIFIILFSNLIIYVINYSLMRRNFEEQSRNMEEGLLEVYIADVEQYFQDIDGIADSIIYNQNVIKILENKKDTSKTRDYLDEINSLYYISRPDLKISFYKEGKYTDYYSIFTNNNATKIPDYRTSDWYKEMDESQAERVIVGNIQVEEEFVYSIFYRIMDEYSQNTIGYLRVDMNLEKLKERVLHTYKDVSGITIWEKKSKRMLFYDQMTVELPEEAFAEQASGTAENKDFMISWDESDSTGWLIAMAVSKQEMNRNLRQLTIVLLLLTGLIVGITLLVSRRCFSVVTVNYKRLVDGMNKVKEGNLDIQVESAVPDEIGCLITEFNAMMQKVEKLIYEVEHKQMLVREAEMKALQQQINPHFICNIMNTIMGLASEGMDEEVITVSQSVGEMLRYNMNMRDMIELREEVRQVQNYIQIMKIRFENRFEAVYEIDESSLECQIVKFSLQPLVENAVKHGLEERDSGGLLRLRVRRRKGCIYIFICDNGVGIEKEQMEEMTVRLRENVEQPLEYIDANKGVGMMNVHLRMRLFYGNAYAIKLFSKKEQGTCVCIRIPAREGLWAYKREQEL